MKRHISFYYERELMDKLQRLRQGSMSFEDYRKQMELFLFRAGLREEETNFQELNLIAETQNLTSTAMLMKPYLLLINYLATRPIFMNTIPKA